MKSLSLGRSSVSHRIPIASKMSRLVLVALALVAASCVLMRDNGAISEAAPASDDGHRTYGAPAQGRGNIAHGNYANGRDLVDTWIDYHRSTGRRDNATARAQPDSARTGQKSAEKRLIDILDLFDDEKSEDEEDVECSICTMNHEHGTMLKLDCGHEFHKACLLQWYRTGRSNGKKCPLCRQDMRVNRMPISEWMLVA